METDPPRERLISASVLLLAQRHPRRSATPNGVCVAMFGAEVTRNLPSDRLLSAPMQPLVLVLVGAHPLPPATDLSDPSLTFSYPCTGASAVPLPADGFSINSSPNWRAFRCNALSCFSFICASYSC